MITAWRSPGSALKPAIYGIAFQLGLLAPDTIIQDRASHFGGYAPRNYDRIFHGTTTVRTALQRSYNLPAVRALDMIGAGYFAGTLEAAGIGLRLRPIRRRASRLHWAASVLHRSISAGSMLLLPIRGSRARSVSAGRSRRRRARV